MIINDVKLIGLSGKKGSGKDTTAALIQILDYLKNESTLLFNDENEMFRYLQGMIERHHKYNTLSDWQNVKFASLVKEMCGALCGVSTQLYEYEILKNQPAFTNGVPFTHREVLQAVGEGMRKLLHEQIWIDALFNKFTPSSKWIVSDCRYVNEAEYIRSKGGILIRINNPNTESKDKHVSEIELDSYQDWDYIINNNGTVQDLAQKVNLLLFT